MADIMVKWFMHTDPEMRPETVWVVLDNEWYHVDDCK